MPPISEYKIINAPKFSLVMTSFRNYFSQFGTISTRFSYTSPNYFTKSEQPQPDSPIGSSNFSTSQAESPQNTFIGNISVRQLPMNRPGDLAQ